MTAPASHWQKRSRPAPIPRDQAVRQGNITGLVYDLLGKDEAIAFLNSDLPGLGGCPLAVASASEEGTSRVQSLLNTMMPVLDHGKAAEPSTC